VRYVVDVMKQILVTAFCFGWGILFFACNSIQENFVSPSPGQNALIAQITPEITPPPEPTPLTERDLKRRAELHELMLKGKYLHDGAIELSYIGDISSVPALLVVLKENPPRPNGAMICTTSHALGALQKITGADPGLTYEDWSAWWVKYQEEQKAKEK
jgi:hypothetical protein